jgi:hypothetical protein
MVRAIAGDNASTNSVVHLHVMGDTPIESSTDTGGLNGTVFVLATLVFILAVGLIMTMLMLQGVISTPKLGPFGNDSDEYDDDSEESAVEVKASAGKKKS